MLFSSLVVRSEFKSSPVQVLIHIHTYANCKCKQIAIHLWLRILLLKY